MSVAYVVVTVFAAVMAGFSAASVFLRAPWVVRPIADYGIPASWLPFLGTVKAAGAVGLLVGLAVPAIGVAAGIGLVLYFAGAVITVVRARWFAHVPFPLIYAAPVVAALLLA
ncbi:DoxX family protein [Streptomyces sp. Q6]|uniref:DoxX family protein n=1 Tax=Streptomyces citrinus TaxID=3118173 RepID=A0ACD5AF14_9ACTN